MTTQARFCTKCGTELAEGARFCTSCGEPVADAPVAAQVEAPATAETAAPQPTAPASSEHVHAIIPNTTLASGFLGMKSTAYVLVLTDRRIVFAHTTKEMLKQAVTDARDSAKAGGKGFFGQWGAQLGAYAALAQRYLELPPEQTLAETPENFAIDRANIQSAKLRAGHVDEDGQQSSDRLIIKAEGKKYTLTLQSGTRQAKEALIAAALI